MWRFRNMRRTKLFFAVEPEVSDDDDDLTHQRKPERSVSHRTPFQTVGEIPGSQIRENVPGTDPVGGSCASNHDTDGTNDLSEGQRGTNMQS